MWYYWNKSKVSGSSVMGRIMSNSVNGKPIPGLKVILGKEKVSQTNEGIFIFESVRSGIYSLQVRGDDYQFSNIEMTIAPSTATLDCIHPVAYKICGSIQKLQSGPSRGFV